MKNNVISSDTFPVFLVGHPVSHSKSPLFQNAAFIDKKIKSVYLALDIEPENFDKVISGFKNIKLFGLNITLPYKTNIIKHLDGLDQTAEEILSVNTIEIKDGKWIGHNTDWYGVYKTLEEYKVPKNQNALIVGSGGAAAGVIYGLRKYGIENISITNRTLSKAEELKKCFSIDMCDYKNLSLILHEYSLIINCTTIDFSELTGKPFNKQTIYFDLKYYLDKPKIKNFIDGSLMLLYQGAEAFKIWTKMEAPLSVMKKAFYK